MAEQLESARWAPLIGRETELGRLQVALDEVVALRGGLVLVSGEPGIGKTRLVEELAGRASRCDALVAWGRVDEEEGAPPYWPWVQLLGAVLAACERSLVSEALDTDAGVIAAIVPEAKELVANVVPSPVLGPAKARFRLHQAVVDFLGRLSRGRRLVVVLEDLHWADIASLELTRFVASRLATLPVLLVVTYRSVDAGSSGAFDDVLATLARQPSLERIALSGLSETEVGRFIAQTVDADPPATAVSAVHARTEGNPFFVGELARLLDSEGLLTDRLGLDPTGAVVPTGVRDALRRRLGRLPKVTSELLVLGAVIGRDFDLAVLSAVADLSEVETLDRMGAAVGAGLVSEDASSVGRFRFSHALVRDTLYGELSALRRATLHARVGAALERRGGSAPADVAELAWHFFHAAPVAGPERGFAYTLEAADAARACMAYERAENDLRRALTLVALMAPGGERAEREWHVQNRLAALLTMTRSHADPEVGRICARARVLAQEVGQADELIATLFGLINFHFVHADFTIVLELAEQLLTIGDQHDNTLALALGHSSKGVVQPYFDHLADARVSLTAALSFARTLDLTAQAADIFRMHPLVIILAYVGRFAWLAGDESEAIAVTDEAVRVARHLDHDYSMAFAMFMSAQLAVLMADAPLAEGRSNDAAAFCQSHGFVQPECWSRLFHGWAISEQGRHKEGVGEMTAALAVHRATGARLNTALLLGLLADGERRRGDVERALALVEEGLTLARDLGDRAYEADLHRRRGELLAGLGPDRAEEAAASLGEALSIARLQGAVAYERRAQAALALLGEGDHSPLAAGPPPAGGLPALSPRERELLGLVGRGLTDKEIAQELVISLATVRSHLERVRDKTGRRRRAELTRLAVDLGLTSN